MKPVYKKAWFWLIITIAISLAEAICIFWCLWSSCVPILRDSGFWTMIGVIVAAVTLITSFVQFNKELQLRKVERTLTSYLQLRESAKDADVIISKATAKGKFDINSIGLTAYDFGIIYSYLNALERVACGINEGLYDIDVISKMSGRLLISQYDLFFDVFIPNRATISYCLSVQNTYHSEDDYFNEYIIMIEHLKKLEAVKGAHHA